MTVFTLLWYPAPSADWSTSPRGTLFKESPTSGAGGGGIVEHTAAVLVNASVRPHKDVISEVVIAYDQRYTF